MKSLNARIYRPTHRLFLALALAWLTSTSGVAFAAPGAHGPDGEHLDSAASAGPAGATSSPRFEAHSETFELVGRLQGGELSMLINRYETNEPVLDAKVEVESGGRKAAAKFHADLSDYAVDDEALLELLSHEGEHALVITIIAGPESDLLDGTLTVSADAPEHDAEYGPGVDVLRVGLATGAVALIALGGLFVGRRRNGTQRMSTPGASK